MSFYDGNASTNRSSHYVNSATTSNILTFNQSSGNIKFECSNPSTNPDTNTKYGSLITTSEDLATLSVTATTSSKATPGDIVFRKSSVNNGSDNDYFTSMSTTDPNSSYNQGFRIRGAFSLVDITTSYLAASNSVHTIQYSLQSNISSNNYFNSSNTTNPVTKSFSVYVDNLGNPSSSFVGTPTSTQTSLVYNCGVPSVKTFEISTGNVNLNDINSIYKYLPTGTIGSVVLPSSSLIATTGTKTTTTFLQLSTSVVDSGNYVWSPSTITNMYFTAPNLTSTTEDIQTKATNLRTSNVTNNDTFTINMFCDRNSFNLSSSRINTTKCPTFYEIDDPDNLDNLTSLSFNQYTNHNTLIENWTPLFCNNAFRTTTNSGSYYKDYSSFGYTTVDYSSTSAYDTTGAETAAGYKWIVFVASGSSETNANSVYNSISINGSPIRSNSNVVAYIEKGGKWGNISNGVNFDSTSTWWDNSPSNLSQTRGAYEDGYGIRLANNVGSVVYFLIGMKNNIQLNLTK